MQATALEVARLRAAAKSAAAERDSLRRNLAAAAEQSKQLDRELQARPLAQVPLRSQWSHGASACHVVLHAGP